MTNTSIVHVSYMKGTEKVSMGRLALKDRRIFFEYNAAFLKTGLNLSPFKLPLKPGVIVSEDPVFDGLFGVFNDSLPDGWGRLLLDRKLMKIGIKPGSLSPLDRLRYVGRHGMGALVYEPEVEESSSPPVHEDLDEIEDEILQFQETDGDQFIDDLLVMNGSSNGARPKILINLKKGSLISRDNESETLQGDWIIKFRSYIDLKDSGPIEYAYHLMAKEAGLEVPEAKLFSSKKGPGYFGVKRFDRLGEKRIHVHTASGLLHVDHRIPSLDYETLMKATLWLTKDVRECEKLFRFAVFNVLMHNRDDHAKNFSFLMDEKGLWHVSPAYDLTFSSGPSGEHCTTVLGEGKSPKFRSLLKIAELGSIKKLKAIQIIEQTKHVASKWLEFAKDAGVTKNSTSMIKAALDQIIKEL